MIYELAKQDDRIVFIGSDLGPGVMEDFKREMPERFFMEGISEQHMVGMAAGLALSGKIVYCHTIATFLTRRALEQVAIDVGLHKANVRLIGAGGGAVYAPLGPTHLAIDDIALMRTIPGMSIMAPCDAIEMEELMPLTVKHQGPVYIRLGKGGDPLVPRNEKGRMAMPSSGLCDIAIVTTGTTTQLACEAARQIPNVKVIHLPFVKPLTEPLFDALRLMRAVVTVEDHSVIGGLGTTMAELLAESGWHGRFRRIGYPDVFPEGYGTQDELRARYGITVEGIISACQN